MWCSCLIFICDSHRYIYIVYILYIYAHSTHFAVLSHGVVRILLWTIHHLGFSFRLGQLIWCSWPPGVPKKALKCWRIWGRCPRMGKLVPKSPGQSSHFHTCPIKSGYGPYLDTEKNGCGIRNVAIYGMKKKQGISCCSSRQSTFITEASSHNCWPGSF